MHLKQSATAGCSKSPGSNSSSSSSSFDQTGKRVEHLTNEYIRNQVSALAGPQEPLIAICEEEEAGMVWPCVQAQHPVEYRPV